MLEMSFEANNFHFALCALGLGYKTDTFLCDTLFP